MYQKAAIRHVCELGDQVIELVLIPTGRSVFDSTKVAHHCTGRDGGRQKSH
jgi:hypothetical protein